MSTKGLAGGVARYPAGDGPEVGFRGSSSLSE